MMMQNRGSVRRYSGALDRLEKIANISKKYGVRFYFI